MGTPIKVYTPGRRISDQKPYQFLPALNGNNIDNFDATTYTTPMSPNNKSKAGDELYVTRGWMLLPKAITKAHCLALRNRAADASDSAFTSSTVSTAVKKRLQDTGIWDPTV